MINWIPVEKGLPKVPWKRYIVLGKNITGRPTVDEATLKWPSTRARFFHTHHVTGITHWAQRDLPEDL